MTPNEAIEEARRNPLASMWHFWILRRRRRDRSRPASPNAVRIDVERTSSTTPPSQTMKIYTIRANERFENTEFSNVILDGMALPLTTAYTCSKCGTQIGFRKHDFEAGAPKHRSNLEPRVARLLDEFAREHITGLRDFLDWACPHCGLAARVYVRFWAGGKHGDAGVSLVTVLEVQPDPDQITE
jgi:hypothetical protein